MQNPFLEIKYFKMTSSVGFVVVTRPSDYLRAFHPIVMGSNLSMLNSSILGSNVREETK